MSRAVTIEITRGPPGKDVPEEMKQKFVGLMVKASGPFLNQLSSVNPGQSSSRKCLVYTVPTENILRALEEKSPRACNWFRNRVGPVGTIRLRAESCVVVV